MAVIKLSDDVAWDGAAWIFRHITNALLIRFEGTRLESRLTSALNDGTWFLNLDDLTHEESSIVEILAQTLTVELTEVGKLNFHSPEFYDGFILRLNMFKNFFQKTKQRW